MDDIQPFSASSGLTCIIGMYISRDCRTSNKSWSWLHVCSYRRELVNMRAPVQRVFGVGVGDGATANYVNIRNNAQQNTSEKLDFVQSNFRYRGA